MKVYQKEEDAVQEAEAYRRCQGSWMTPAFYEEGPGYIVIEYMKGPTLYSVLKDAGTITSRQTEQILRIYTEMKRLGFTRRDAALFHLYVREDGTLAVIDLVHAFTKRYRKPIVLLRGLKRLGLLGLFLDKVQTMAPERYEKWSLRRRRGVHESSDGEA